MQRRGRGSALLSDVAAAAQIVLAEGLPRVGGVCWEPASPAARVDVSLPRRQRPPAVVAAMAAAVAVASHSVGLAE